MNLFTNIHSKFWIVFFLVVLNLNAFSKDRRREDLDKADQLNKAKQELVFYQKQYEKVKAERWQHKRNVVSKKEAFQDVWNDLRRDVDKVQTDRTQLNETLLRLENQKESRQKEVDELLLRRKEFGILIAEKLSEFENELRNSFPIMREELREQVGTIKSFIEKGNYHPRPDLFQNIFYQLMRLLDLGESRDIERNRFPVFGVAERKSGMKDEDGARMVAGYQIRLGTVYQGFVSTEGVDAAIMVKTGKLNEKSWTWLEDLKPENRVALNIAATQIASEDSEALMIPVDVQLRKATGAGFSSVAGVSWYKSLLNELKGAGFAIYLLAIILIIGLIVVAEKIFVFSTRSRNGKRFAIKRLKEIESGNIESALAKSKKAKGVIPLVLTAIMEKQYKGRSAAEDKAYEVMLGESSLLEKRISTINILAAAAPLVGLLGTVSGMVNLFAAITMNGTNDPKIMAAGIGEALLSTKWGLLVAIPMLLIYNWMSTKSSSIISNMEKYSSKCINAVFGEISSEVTSSDQAKFIKQSEINDDNKLDRNVEISEIEEIVEIHNEETAGSNV